MTEGNQWTLRDRLERWPPFLVLALSRVRTKPLTVEQKKVRLWNRKARKKRRQLARKGIVIPRKPVWRRLKLSEIQFNTTLSKELVRELARRPTWDGIRIENCLAFMDACGFDLLRIERKTKLMKRQHLKGGLFSHLTTQQKQRFAKAVELARQRRQLDLKLKPAE